MPTKPTTAREGMRKLADVLTDLYAAELNAEITLSSFWDDGWMVKVRLGDEMNGFKGSKKFQPHELAKAADWLLAQAERRRGFGPRSAE